MGYYMRGDYYRRGDIWSTLGKGILGVVGGAVTGGPIGAVTGGIRAFTGGPANPGPKNPFNPFQPGGFPGFGFGSSAGKGKKGKRPKKGEPGWHPRRMHVTNPKALRRAIRRAQGFEKLAMKVLSFSRPHGRPKGHPYFKRKRAAR